VTPTEAIAKLDNQMAKHGQTVTLRRRTTPTATDPLTIPAFSRGYKPAELVGTIQQGDTMVVLSPTNLTGAFLSKLPTTADTIDVAGVTKQIKFIDPVRMLDVLVRINLQVRG
jgi:hypothetical protein